MVASAKAARGAQKTPPAATTFRTGVAEVRVDVQVLQGRKPLSGLTVSDFEVRDEGQPQPLSRFGRDTDPVSLVILIDVSGSMKKFARQMASTAQSALRQLTPEDRVQVLAFAKGTETLTDFTNKFDQVAREIDVGIEQHGLPSGTAIYGALLEGAEAMKEHIAQHPAGRRAILILTDNESLNYQVTAETVLKAMFEIDAVVYAIVTRGAERPRPPVNGYRNPDFTPTDMFQIAEETGGEALRVDRADRAFPELIAQLRTRYTLFYGLPAGAAKGQFRKVEVSLTEAARRRYGNVTVRARRGYFV